MGASVIPAAATAQANWVEIASATPTSGSTVSFTGLTEYRNYKVSYFNIFTANATFAILRFNNDASSSYAFLYQADSGAVVSQAAVAFIRFPTSIDDTDGASGVLTIMDANQIIKDITYFGTKNGSGTSNDAMNGEAFWNNTGIINRIDFILSGTTFTSGTFKVYGSN